MKTIGFVGLGKMGLNMTARLIKKGWTVVAYARRQSSRKKASKVGAIAAKSLADLAIKVPAPRIIWLMIPAGKAVDSVITALLPHLSQGDVIVDGGNSFYEDSIKRAKSLAKKGVFFVDAGVSGGIKGAREGASIGVGCEKRAFVRIKPVLEALSAKDGFAHLGGPGTGHFVKMVHNAIEYCLLEGYGEGYQLLAVSRPKIDLRKVTKLWRNGSVIRSWLLDLLQEALEEDPKLSRISGIVCGGTTGKWAINSAKRFGISLPSVRLAIRQRYRSRKKPNFASKVVAIIRHKFGGHKIPRMGERCEE
ncbi:MAG: decarboxylating 6-phosphogluconate dehydrogenase [Candidatus Woesearchaeota archaeon]